jgi:hypothetical protein
MKIILVALLIVALSGCVTTPNHSVDYAAGLRERNYRAKIAETRSLYSNDYIKSAIDISGKCKKVLNMPRMFVNSTAVEVETDYKKLCIDYPAYNSTPLKRCLGELITQVTGLRYINTLNNDYAYSPYSYIVRITFLIEEIEKGLDV